MRGQVIVKCTSSKLRTRLLSEADLSLEIKLLLHVHPVIKAVTSCSTHKIDQQETDG